MGKEIIKRNYKDGIFRSLFNNEEKLLELYNALSGKEYEKECYTDAVYSKRPILIPTPELYVFYDGKDDAPAEWEMKLSDTYKGKCDRITVEAVVKVFNVNYDKGAELLKKCKTLQEYSLFMRMVRSKFLETGRMETAVKESIRECIESDILAKYLMEQRGSIMSVLEVNLTREQCEAIRWKDGYEEGQENKAYEIAGNFKKAGIPIEVIAENTGLTVEEVEKL